MVQAHFFVLIIMSSSESISTLPFQWYMDFMPGNTLTHAASLPSKRPFAIFVAVPSGGTVTQQVMTAVDVPELAEGYGGKERATLSDILTQTKSHTKRSPLRPTMREYCNRVAMVAYSTCCDHSSHCL